MKKLPQKLPSEIEDLITKVSKEIISKQDGYYFTIDKTELYNENKSKQIIRIH